MHFCYSESKVLCMKCIYICMCVCIYIYVYIYIYICIYIYVEGVCFLNGKFNLICLIEALILTIFICLVFKDT